MGCGRLKQLEINTVDSKTAGVISVFILPGMLKDVEDELQRKVKVFVLYQFNTFLPFH